MGRVYEKKWVNCSFISRCGLWIIISEFKRSNFQGSRVRLQIGGELLIFSDSIFFKKQSFFFFFFRKVLLSYVKETHILNLHFKICVLFYILRTYRYHTSGTFHFEITLFINWLFHGIYRIGKFGKRQEFWKNQEICKKCRNFLNISKKFGK